MRVSVATGAKVVEVVEVVEVVDVTGGGAEVEVTEPDADVVEVVADVELTGAVPGTSPSSNDVVDVGPALTVVLVTPGAAEVVDASDTRLVVAARSGEPGESTTWPATLRTAASATPVATIVARTHTNTTPVLRNMTVWSHADGPPGLTHR